MIILGFWTERIMKLYVTIKRGFIPGHMQIYAQLLEDHSHSILNK
jgi:hypothetical protein